MDGLRLFQVHLLSQMRAAALVGEALRRLRVDSEEVSMVDAEIAKLGLHQPGHPMALYERLIGAPFHHRITNDSDPYRRRFDQYRLPLWSRFAVSVFGSSEGQTAGIVFENPHGSPSAESSSIAEIRPWSVVEDQVRPILERSRVIEEWYPMKDYESPIGPDGGGEVGTVVLQFDFGLLQGIVAPRQDGEPMSESD